MDKRGIAQVVKNIADVIRDAQNRMPFLASAQEGERNYHIFYEACGGLRAFHIEKTKSGVKRSIVAIFDVSILAKHRQFLGKSTISNGKSQFLMSKFTILNMAIFNSHVQLPEDVDLVGGVAQEKNRDGQL